MAAGSYKETFQRFLDFLDRRPRGETMPALIVDSPWLPGYGGVDAMDFFFDPCVWLAVYEWVLEDLPGTVFLPGAWIEFGMAAEPSGWACRVQWNHEGPPGIHPFPGGLEGLLQAPDPDPECDGLMPLILRRYQSLAPRLAEMDFSPRVAAARGPLAVASHLLGVTEFLLSLKTEPEKTHLLLEKTTRLCVRWLQAQLERMEDPAGVFVLDDLVGLMSPRDAEAFAIPYVKEVFQSFPGKLRIFHNDTPNEKVFPLLAPLDLDVFNFSHETTLERARELLGPKVVLMGNLPPLDLLARGNPGEVAEETRKLLDRIGEAGPVLLSVGGGVSPGTPIENLQAMLETLEKWSG